MAVRRKTTKGKAKTKAARKTTRKSPARKKTPARKKALSYNGKAGMKAYRELEKQVTQAWAKLQKDVKNRDKQAILKGRNHLLLLLGECNYMSRECVRCLQKQRKQ